MLMLDSFKSSFYGLWFCSLPDTLLGSAINDIEQQSKHLKSCVGLYAEYVCLQTALFLLTFVDVGDAEVEFDGQKVALRSLGYTGAVAYVKKDSIESTLSREFFAPKLPEGMDFKDFPFGRIKARITHIECTCTKAGRAIGTGANLPRPRCFDGVANRQLQSHVKTCHQC